MDAGKGRGESGGGVNVNLKRVGGGENGTANTMTVGEWQKRNVGKGREISANLMNGGGEQGQGRCYESWTTQVRERSRREGDSECKYVDGRETTGRSTL